MHERNDPSTTAVKTERSDDMQKEESGEAKNDGNSKSKGKGRGNAEVGNHSTKGGQNQNQNQQPKQRRQQHNRNNNDHPNGQQSGSASASAKKRRGGGQVDAGQKRKVTESVTTGIAGTDGGDGGHASKRHKIDEARPHPEFWHPDGSVIIRVEKTEFRLHQSILQKQSAQFASVFEEMRNLTLSGGGFLEVEIDGHHLPVLSMFETTADDFAMLLTVIEEPMKYADEIPPIRVLAGVLRAARVLSFKAQRKWAERNLERMWSANSDTLTRDPIPHAAVALALARTCNLRGVEKRASYELLRAPTFWQAIDKAPAAHGEVYEDSDTDSEMGVDKLPRAVLLRLLFAREQLALAWAQISATLHITRTLIISGIGSRDGSSTNNEGCRCAFAFADSVHAHWLELVPTGSYRRRMIDPLMGLQDLMEISWMDEGFCKKCVAANMKAWDRFRRGLWDDLDKWLQLTAAENA